MAKWLSLGSIVVGGLGFFVGFFYLFGDPAQPEMALAAVALISVGAVGVMGWLRHFVFQKSDAARMGWVTDRPEWMYEVGFANLAFGLMGITAALASLGMPAMALSVIGYSLYLLQATVLHVYQFATGAGGRSIERLMNGVVWSGLFALMMLFFGLNGLLGWVG